jgi:hypothetical protein
MTILKLELRAYGLELELELELRAYGLELEFGA